MSAQLPYRIARGPKRRDTLADARILRAISDYRMIPIVAGWLALGYREQHLPRTAR